MKNIHILPTDKPSNIGYYTDIKDTRLYILSNGNKIGNYKNNWNPQNIYITNDEEISGFENNIWVVLGTRVFLWKNTMALVSSNKPKEIILTTDQDLIKDGVQGIDDEFLEWFIKNPSCEEVSFIIRSAWLDNGLIIDSYQITIQKEEPRQEMPWLPKETFDKYHKLKQEKLEEVAKKLKGKELFKKSNDRARELLSEIKLLPIVDTLEEYIERETKSIIEPSLRASAITFLRYGAKWQKEQEKNKFSDEEMKNTIQIVFELTNKGYSVDEIFEQFKKK